LSLVRQELSGIPLCHALAAAGLKVTAYSRSEGEFGFPSGVDHKLGDILDEESLTSAADGADVIFHAAAAVHGSVDNSADFTRLNVDGTANVIKVAENIGAKLVHISSANVAGFRDGYLTDEYAASKSMAEELITAAVNQGLDAVIVRPATVFGNESGKAGMIVDRVMSESLKVLPAPRD